MASQFADLYEKVDGYNTYAGLLDLACGRRPRVRRREGKHAMAASCVLRRFEDAKALAVPSRDDVERLTARWPDLRVEIHAHEGQWLSHELQDPASYRYGVVNIGGRDRDEILAVLDECRRGLPFVFGK